MAIIKITSGAEAIVDNADYLLLSSFTWWLDRKGYASTTVRAAGKPRNKTNLRMHRVLYPARPGFVMDHINRIKLDNRRANLRYATHKENVQNQGLSRANKSGFKGVSKTGTKLNPWVARLLYNSVYYHLGCFKTPEEAAIARKQAEQNPNSLKIRVPHWTESELELLKLHPNITIKEIATKVNRSYDAVRDRLNYYCR